MYLYFHKTRVALVVKFNKISLQTNSLQPTLNLKRNRPPHWSINKLIAAYDRIGNTCCRIETITGHQFNPCLAGTPLQSGTIRKKRAEFRWKFCWSHPNLKTFCACLDSTISWWCFHRVMDILGIDILAQ